MLLAVGRSLLSTAWLRIFLVSFTLTRILANICTCIIQFKFCVFLSFELRYCEHTNILQQLSGGKARQLTPQQRSVHLCYRTLKI